MFDAKDLRADESQTILRGLEVLELFADTPIAIASHMLGRMGAHIRRVRVDGDGPFARRPNDLDDLIAAGKDDVGWDGSDATNDHLCELAASADLVLTSRTDLELRRFGLDSDALRTRSPRLVFGTLTPFGQTGPLRDMGATEFVLQAMSGILGTTGHPGGPPTRVGVDLGAHLGAAYLMTACLSALIERRRSGQGQRADIAQFDCLVASLTNFIANSAVTGEVPRPLGNRHVFSSPWNAYLANDGYVVICVVTDRQWAKVAGIIGAPDLGTAHEFVGQLNRRNRADLIDPLVASWAAKRSKQEILTILDAAEVPCGDIPALPTVLLDPDLQRRGLVAVDAKGRPALGSPIVISASASQTTRSVHEPAEAVDMADGPLAGTRVVEVAMLAAGPFCSRILANLGADVVKIEPLAGEVGRFVQPLVNGVSAIFNINCGDKRSVSLDLLSPEGRTAALRIVSSADVLVENLTPGRLTSWGMGYTELSSVVPGIVYASVTGFGQDGKRSSKRAYDTVVQAMTGMMDVTGWPTDPPTKAGISASDVLGSVVAPIGILAALYRRNVDEDAGRVRSFHVDTSMYDVSAWATLKWWPAVSAGAGASRNGNTDRRFLWEDVIPCQDRGLAVSIQDDHAAGAVAEMVRVRDLGPLDAESFAARVLPALRSWALATDCADAVKLLRARSIPSGPVLGVDEVMTHPQVLSREMIDSVTHPIAGSLIVTGSPIKLSRTPSRVRRAAPMLGEHSVDSLRSAGLAEAEIDALLVKNVVVQSQVGETVRT